MIEKLKGVKKPLFDFDGCRIGYNIAAAYILQYLRHVGNTQRISIVDFKADDPDSFPIWKYFPDICKNYYKHRGKVKTGDYAVIDFGNLWITSPSLLLDQDNHSVPSLKDVEKQPNGYMPFMTNVAKSKEFVTIHGLYDAKYNTGRNMKEEQIIELCELLEKAKIPFRVIPTDRSLTVCEIIDNLLAKAIICVSGDTGMSHLAAALDKDIIALYPDNKNDVLTYEPVRQSTNSSSPWSSDPLSRKYKKFILQNNEFNVRDVFEYAFAKYKEIVG